MKLIGSKLEADCRNELLASNQEIMAAGSRLGKAIESQGHEKENAYVLHWIPDQTEDTCLVLVGGSSLVSIELSNTDQSAPPIVEHISLSEYEHGLSRVNQVKLAVAKELASEEHNK